LRARRSAYVATIGPDGARTAAEAAMRHLLPHIPHTATVAIYLALKDELNPEPLIQALHARGQAIALPALFDRSAMRFLAWAPGEPLERGPMRLRQPLQSASERVPDLVVAPLLAFDRAGHRLVAHVVGRLAVVPVPHRSPTSRIRPRQLQAARRPDLSQQT
jgi:5-formyltetrahydrofolate cyclo-ligase